MAPRHDEIVKKTKDGFIVAWDTTNKDDARTKAVDKVVKEQATELGALFGAHDIVFRKGDEVAVVEIKKERDSRSSRDRARRESSKS